MTEVDPFFVFGTFLMGFIIGLLVAGTITMKG